MSMTAASLLPCVPAALVSLGLLSLRPLYICAGRASLQSYLLLVIAKPNFASDDADRCDRFFCGR